jgi:hypothetical protein
MSRGYEYAKTTAAKMLSAGLQRAHDERSLSLRTIGKMLNYKQAVVLSHMALGRVPIPIDRAEDLAEVLDMDKAKFLTAVVEQRHPEVNWSLIATGPLTDQATPLAQELEAILGTGLDGLSAAQRAVMREVASDPRPRRRWLSVHEVPVMELVRAWRPQVVEEGLTATDRMILQETLVRPK